jgi:hypothetical protein
MQFDRGPDKRAHFALAERVQREHGRSPTENSRILPYITDFFTSCLMSPTFS